jgi:hypothetical protein
VPAEKIQQLIVQLSADDFTSRETAYKELLKLGESAVPALQMAANSAELETALRARKLLQDIAAAPRKPEPSRPPVKVPDNVKKLIEQLGDEHFEVREKATKELIALGPEAVPGLRGALDHSDPEVHARARRILDTITTSLSYLKDALKDPDKQVRKEAAEVLERLGDKAKEAIPWLVEALKDKEEEVREAVMMALIAIDPDNKALAETTALKATVNGKYGKLLKRIHVPQDKAGYTEFHDYGEYPATDYAGYQGLPAGYWVYVYPHWYIWGELKKK